MKTLKKALAIFLFITTLFSLLTISASALTVGDTITWFEDYDPESTYKAVYKGAIIEGSTQISDPEEYSLFYGFEAEKDGYYMLTSSNHFFFADTYSNNTAKNYKENIYCGYNDENGWDINCRIYYLTEGETYLLYTECDSIAKELKIEYYADEIIDVKYDETELNSIITDIEDFYYEETDKKGNIYEDIEIVFSKNGVETTVSRSWINFTYEDTLVNGENNVTLVLPGYEKEITIGLYESSDYIESIEINNAEDYLYATKYYNNWDFEYPDLDGLSITLNFKNGTKQTVIYDSEKNQRVEFPNEKFYHIDLYPTVDESRNGTNKFTLFAVIGYNWFSVKEYDVTEASISENFSMLTKTISNSISDLFEHIIRWIGYMFEDGRYDFWTDMIISEIEWTFKYCIAEQISLFFKNAF